MPVTGGWVWHICGRRTLIARTAKRMVQFGFHEFLDKPAYSTPDDRIDRVKPSRPEELRGLLRRVSAILRHGVISIGVSPPSLARCTCRRLHHPEFPPLLRRHRHPLPLLLID